MIKALLTILTKLADARLEKAGVETLILKNENYIAAAKQIWYMIDENFRISQSIAEKLTSKVEEFNKSLLARFPELTQEDVDNLRQAVAGEINQGKAAVVDNSAIIKQLQETNSKLTSENSNLKDQLSKVKDLVAIAANNSEITNNNQGVTVATDNSQATQVVGGQVQ